MTDQRWPRSVYGEGEEPDYRFSLANERTFLAWLRTGLALVAAGVAVDVVDLSVGEGVKLALAGILLVLGGLSSVLAYLRWSGSERAMRRGEPLPALGVAAIVISGVLAALTLAALIVLGTRP
ncbi:DUF202 domain-containing protein [Janibacter sp. YIM B02568]|uniref:YidH family protein n=1 Tax=Janibacter endophyticus TaxID=2806261 RepID=UPI001950D79B|nr:DUF202 domain-containing protein [Janibacter endophyticus]MBM6544625.1 DUF202 domain-containing protein [Janibacter endophyticus]